LIKNLILNTARQIEIAHSIELTIQDKIGIVENSFVNNYPYSHYTPNRQVYYVNTNTGEFLRGAPAVLSLFPLPSTKTTKEGEHKGVGFYK
jgi:hypothetical protein